MMSVIVVILLTIQIGICRFRMDKKYQFNTQQLGKIDF